MIQWSESQQAIREVVKKFVQDEIVPKVHELEHGDLPPYEVLRKLVVELKRHKIELPEATSIVAQLAASDPAFRRVLVDLLANKPRLSAEESALLRQVEAPTGTDLVTSNPAVTRPPPGPANSTWLAMIPVSMT